MKAAMLISKQVFCCLVNLFSVSQVLCPPIQEEFKHYQCSHVKEGHVIIYSPEQNISLCDQSWEFGKRPIADLNRGECSRPCIHVSSAEIRLTDCINVTLKIVCILPGHRIEESRVHFFGKPSSSQGEFVGAQVQNHHIGLYCAGVAVCALVVCLICCAMKTDIKGQDNASNGQSHEYLSTVQILPTYRPSLGQYPQRIGVVDDASSSNLTATK